MTSTNCREHNASSPWNILDRQNYTSEMAKLCVGVSSKFFCIINHILNRAVSPVGGGMININCFQFNVEGRYVASVKANDLLADLINFSGSCPVIFCIGYHSVAQFADHLEGSANRLFFSQSFSWFLGEKGVFHLLFELAKFCEHVFAVSCLTFSKGTFLLLVNGLHLELKVNYLYSSNLLHSNLKPILIPSIVI